MANGKAGWAESDCPKLKDILCLGWTCVLDFLGQS